MLKNAVELYIVNYSQFSQYRILVSRRRDSVIFSLFSQNKNPYFRFYFYNILL